MMWSEIFFIGFHYPYSSSSFFWQASRCTVSSYTPVTSQSMVHINDGIGRWLASGSLGLWRYLLPPIWCSTGISAAWLPHNITDVISILFSENSQPLKTIKTSLSDEQLGCIRTESKPQIHILEPQGHNFRFSFSMYLLDPLHNIASIILWHNVPLWGISILPCSASEFSFFSSWATGSFLSSDPS